MFQYNKNGPKEYSSTQNAVSRNIPVQQKKYRGIFQYKKNAVRRDIPVQQKQPIGIFQYNKK
jgi:hypothetical protein